MYCVVFLAVGSCKKLFHYSTGAEPKTVEEKCLHVPQASQTLPMNPTILSHTMSTVVINVAKLGHLLVEGVFNSHTRFFMFLIKFHCSSSFNGCHHTKLCISMNGSEMIRSPICFVSHCYCWLIDVAANKTDDSIKIMCELRNTKASWLRMGHVKLYAIPSAWTTCCTLAP